MLLLGDDLRLRQAEVGELADDHFGDGPLITGGIDAGGGDELTGKVDQVVLMIVTLSIYWFYPP